MTILGLSDFSVFSVFILASSTFSIFSFFSDFSTLGFVCSLLFVIAVVIGFLAPLTLETGVAGVISFLIFGFSVVLTSFVVDLNQ